jgi:hypothetical protein
VSNVTVLLDETEDIKPVKEDKGCISLNIDDLQSIRDKKIAEYEERVRLNGKPTKLTLHDVWRKQMAARKWSRTVNYD